MKNEIQQYLVTRLGLTLKDNWQVFCVDCRALDYMGFRFYRNKTTLRKSILMKAFRKARKVGRKDKMTLHEIRQMMSYFGWLNVTDTYNAYVQYIKPFFNFQYGRRRISNHERAANYGKSRIQVG